MAKREMREVYRNGDNIEVVVAISYDDEVYDSIEMQKLSLIMPLVDKLNEHRILVDEATD